MATHSGTLAWKIPSTEEPGGLQSMRDGKESDVTERLSPGNEVLHTAAKDPMCHNQDPVQPINE